MLQYAWGFHLIVSDIVPMVVVTYHSLWRWCIGAIGGHMHLFFIGYRVPMIGYQWIKMGMMVPATMSCVYFISFNMTNGSWSWGFCYCNVGLIEVYTFPFYCTWIRVDGAEIFRDLCEHSMQLFLANVIIMGTGSALMCGYLVRCCQMGCGLHFYFLRHLDPSSYATIMVQL